MEKRYIQTFETGEFLQEALDNNELGKPYVAYLEDEQRIVWNEVPPTPPDPYLSMPLTFEILSAGTISATTGMSLEYSLNDGEWTTYADAELNLQQGDVLKLRGNNEKAPEIRCTAYFNAYGNAYSVLSATGFENITALTVESVCSQMFATTNMVSAENLKLPATTLADYCYFNMFGSCKSLTSAPELPATTLAQNCYHMMFGGCTNLTTAPELPATTLAQNCYKMMFNNCSSLTTAPELPATTLVQYCYSNMFSNCTSLATAPELPATTLAQNCYERMLQNCTSLSYIKCLATDISASNCTFSWVRKITSTGTFVKSPNMTSWTTGYSGIPTGWTVQDANI